jgi:hypothetical protein
VYDALVERGMHTHHDLLAATIGAAGEGWPGVRAAARASVRIAADQPVLGQLLFTPAVPGFVPSEQAYAPSVRANELLRTAIARVVQRRQPHPAAASDNGVALFIALVAGIAVQQTANDPRTGFDEGCYTALLDPARDMYAGYFAAS